MTISQIDLQKDVIDELADDPAIDASNISVGARDGIITLDGSVPTYAEKLAAERAAKRVTGVRGLADELRVDLQLLHQRNDSDIIAAALNAMAWDVLIPDDKITLTISHGWLTLEGEVEWQFQKQHAADIIGHLSGIRGCTNNITVTSPPSPGDVVKKIRAAYQRSADLDANALSVEIHGSKAILRGPVHSWAERDRAARAAYSVPGISEVENHIYFTER